MKINNILTLTKVNFIKFFSNMFGQKNSIKKNISIFALLSIFIMLSMSTFCFEILKLTQTSGDIKVGLEILFTFTSIFLLLFLSMQSFDTLFKSKDNQMLFALPLKDSEILLSRILTTLLTTYLYQSFILIPTIICYYIVVGFNFLSLIYFIVAFIVFPLIPIMISVILSFIFGKIGSKNKNNNILKVIILMLYMGLIISLQYLSPLIANGIATNSTFIQVIKYAFYRNYLFSSAVSQNILSLLFFVLISLTVFILPFLFVGNNYKKICLSFDEGTFSKKKKVVYKNSTTFKTLLKKDLKQYFSSFIYVFNTIIGPIFMIGASIYFVVERQSFAQIFSQIPFSPANLISSIFCFLCGMTIISACSISIEGKQFWLVKSLPITTRQIFWSKLLIQLIVVVPVLILCSIVVCIALSIPWWATVLIVLICLLFEFLIDVIGLIINIKHPVLDAINDTVVVKQSFSTFISILIGIISPIIIAVANYSLNLILPEYASLAIIVVLLLALSILFCNILFKKSSKSFEKLEK